MSGYLEWESPNTCTNQRGDAFTLEGVTLGQNPQMNGWVQTGWVKRQGYQSPKEYCEFTGEDGTGYWVLLEFSLPSASSYKYSMQHDANDREWECLLGSTLMAVRPSASMRFQSGTGLNAQGETNTTHAQIGNNAPGKFLFSSLSYLQAGTWKQMNVTVNTPPAPYGVDEPQAGQMRNWTNAH